MKNDDLFMTMGGVVVAVLVIVASICLLTREPNRGKAASTCEIILEEREKALGISYDVKESDIYKGKPAEVIFGEGFARAREFRTKIREGAASGPNFAGHYTIVSWGCGTGCEDRAIVDAKTGEIVAFGLQSTMGSSYSLDSRILTINPKENFPDESDTNMESIERAVAWSRIPRLYYEMNESEGRSNLESICVENPFEGQI